MAIGLRAMIYEEAYAVVARVVGFEFRSDRLAEGFRIANEMRAHGREVEVLEEEGSVSVRVLLGDAPETSFAVAAFDLEEVASCR